MSAPARRRPGSPHRPPIGDLKTGQRGKLSNVVADETSGERPVLLGRTRRQWNTWARALAFRPCIWEWRDTEEGRDAIQRFNVVVEEILRTQEEQLLARKIGQRAQYLIRIKATLDISIHAPLAREERKAVEATPTLADGLGEGQRLVASRIFHTPM